MPSLDTRVHIDEMMDDFSVTDSRLTDALDELRWVNRLLGGYATTLSTLAPYLRSNAGRRIRILDVGTGVADYPEQIVRWADLHGADVEVVAIDANPVTTEYARATVSERLPQRLARRIRIETAEAPGLPYGDGSFDVSTAALFLHHFEHDEAVRVVADLNRVARHGVVVNDLHRHRAAYASIQALVHVLPVSAMFRHDGPLSVRRGFTRDELSRIALSAGLRRHDVRWHWAFRLLLTSLTVR